MERYLDEMERADQQDKPAQEITAAELKHKIEQLKQRKGKYEELLEKLKRSGEKQISLTDADSRAMALTPKGEVSYNVQTAVDSKHHLIVAQDVTNEGLDNHQLFSMAQGAKEILGQDEIEVVADMLLRVPAFRSVPNTTGIFSRIRTCENSTRIPTPPL